MENNNEPVALTYPENLAEQVKGMMTGDRYFALLRNASNHPDVLPIGVDYVQTVGLHREGLPEIIVYGGFPDEFVGSLVKHLMIEWSSLKKDNPDYNFVSEIPLAAAQDMTSAIAVARTVELTAENKDRYGRVIEHVFPGAEYRMMQLMLPDEQGRLPDSKEYLDDIVQLFLGETEKKSDVAVEKFKGSVLADAISDEFEPLRLHVEEHGLAIYHEATDGSPVAFTVGLSKKNLPELMISGKFSKQFIGELLQQFAKHFSENPPNVSSMRFDTHVENRDGQRIECHGQMIRVTELNRTITTDRVILGMWPDHEYEVFQILLPNSDGILPDSPSYVDLEDTRQGNFGDTSTLAELMEEAMRPNDTPT